MGRGRENKKTKIAKFEFLSVEDLTFKVWNTVKNEKVKPERKKKGLFKGRWTCTPDKEKLDVYDRLRHHRGSPRHKLLINQVEGNMFLSDVHFEFCIHFFYKALLHQTIWAWKFLRKVKRHKLLQLFYKVSGSVEYRRWVKGLFKKCKIVNFYLGCRVIP